MNISESFKLIKEVIGKTYGIPTSALNGVDKLQKRWERNKKWMLPFFDDNGRKEINLESGEEYVTKEDIKQMYDAYICDVTRMAQKDKYRRFVDNYPIVYNLIHQIDLFEPQELLNNRIMATTVFYPYTDKIVPPNTKISKYFSMLPLSEFGYNPRSNKDEEMAREFINMAFSMFVARLNAVANVALSINPLDYLLMSAHTTGWRSCHNFIDGCYRTGGLAYMCDKESVVAYAYSNMDSIGWTNIKWPVKKWRQMVFLDKDNLCAIHSRQYPGINSIYEKKARRLSAKVLSDYGKCEYKWYVKGASKGHDEEQEPHVMGIKVIGRSKLSFTDPVSSTLRMKDGILPYSIRIGTTLVPCILCGKNRGSSGRSSLFCGHC